MIYRILCEAALLAHYIKQNSHLPSYFVTKQTAICLGWKRGSLSDVIPGMVLGGDLYYNRNGMLPQGNYHECDLGTLGKPTRGPYRLVFSNNDKFYVTLDHYQSFIEIIVE